MTGWLDMVNRNLGLVPTAQPRHSPIYMQPVFGWAESADSTLEGQPDAAPTESVGRQVERDISPPSTERFPQVPGLPGDQSVLGEAQPLHRKRQMETHKKADENRKVGHRSASGDVQNSPSPDAPQRQDAPPSDRPSGRPGAEQARLYTELRQEVESLGRGLKAARAAPQRTILHINSRAAHARGAENQSATIGPNPLLPAVVARRPNPLPNIQVRIGRVDLRAISPPRPVAAPPKTAQSEPMVSLEDYLRARSRKGS